MEILTAFLVGVLVGHWVLLFYLLRVVTRLIRLIDAMEADRIVDNENIAGILNEGRK